MLSSRRYDSPRGHQGASSPSYHISRRLLPCGDTMSHLEGRGQSWLCSRNCHPGGLNLPSTAAPAPAGARGREHSSQHPTRGWLPLSASGEAPEARDKLSREKKPPNPALPLPLTRGWVPRGCPPAGAEPKPAEVQGRSVTACSAFGSISRGFNSPPAAARRPHEPCPVAGGGSRSSY